MPEINQHGQTVNDIVPDWKCARALTRTLLTGQYCRLEPLDADRHSADLFEAYALGDDSDKNVHSPIEAGGPGHGCGHCALGAGKGAG